MIEAGIEDVGPMTWGGHPFFHADFSGLIAKGDIFTHASPALEAGSANTITKTTASPIGVSHLLVKGLIPGVVGGSMVQGIMEAKARKTNFITLRVDKREHLNSIPGGAGVLCLDGLDGQSQKGQGDQGEKVSL